MTEDKVTLTECRPHTAVIIAIGFNSMTLFVEEPIDQIKTVLERIKNQEYFTLNVAMQKHRNYILWDPECDDDITYSDWDVKKATVKAFHKLYKKQNIVLKAHYCCSDKDFQSEKFHGLENIHVEGDKNGY